VFKFILQKGLETEAAINSLEIIKQIRKWALARDHKPIREKSEAPAEDHKPTREQS
jgi:hypothetical protein